MVQMSKIIICDLEANGLEPDKVHCAVLQELGSDSFYECTGSNETIRTNLLRAIKEDYTYVWHNGLGYDLPVLESCCGISYSIAPDLFNQTSVQFIDTLV